MDFIEKDREKEKFYIKYLSICKRDFLFLFFIARLHDDAHSITVFR